MNFSLKKLIKYCEAHSSPQNEVLYKLERETHLKTLAPQMLSGHLQGQLLTLLSQLMQPQTILEIGTFTGYAAICLAQGLAENGTLHAIEANEELAYIIRKYIRKAELEEKIKLHIGDAKKIVPQIEGEFDIVFIDAGKNDYALYFDMVVDRVKTGGLIIADNVLWSGKVIMSQHDKDTITIHNFNEKVKKEERVESLMLPLRDGILIARKN